ncbi:MAG: DUF3006 domain-containing protein [Oscillospiraceae bacterium]
MNNYKYIIVDRIEQQDSQTFTDFDKVICNLENQKQITFSRKELYDGVKEGDVFVLEDGKYHLDCNMTQQKRAENINLQNQLFTE